MAPFHTEAGKGNRTPLLYSLAGDRIELDYFISVLGGASAKPGAGSRVTPNNTIAFSAFNTFMTFSFTLLVQSRIIADRSTLHFTEMTTSNSIRT